MTVKLAYYEGAKIYYLTPFVTNIMWSGDVAQASRALTVSLNEMNVRVGRDVRFYVDDDEVFRGIVFETSVASDGACQFTAHDYNHYLTKNTDSHKFVGKKASDIVRFICQQYGIPAVKIADTGYVIPKLILRDKTIYDMVTIALTETRKKTGRRFLLANENGKLTLTEVSKQVKRLTIANGANLLSASYAESIEDLRNSVRMTGKSGEDAVGVTVSDSDSIKKYGLMRDKMHESEMTDAQLKPIASALLGVLSEVATESNVEAIGEASVISGRTVQISEQKTGIVGGFYVLADTHNFAPNGKHTMSLKVSQSLDLAELEYEAPIEPTKETDADTDLDSDKDAPTEGTKPQDTGGNFMRPAVGEISSVYGMRKGKMHYGIDIAGKGKIPIVAAADGKVIRSHYSSTYGECIILRHTINGKQYETLYAHMRSGSRQYKTGATVKRGAVIGYMGNTGESSGQHLHYEIHSPEWNTKKSNAINPAPYL